MADKVNTTKEAVNALLDGVTDGPWQITGQPDKICVADSYTKNGAAKTIATVNTPTWMGATEPYANARFIAAARELVPALLARAERAEAFIAEFAAFKFAEAPRPHIRDPQDEPDQYVDAQEVWAWQADAKELLK